MVPMEAEDLEQAARLCDSSRAPLRAGDALHLAAAGEEAGLAKLYAGLTGERPSFRDAEDAATCLAETLQQKNCPPRCDHRRRWPAVICCQW
jgi:hypothetical protein